MGILHGVENGKLHKRSPPTDTGDDWLGTSTLIGTSGWSDFHKLFFMFNGKLYGVYEDSFYKGSPPSSARSTSDQWIASSTLIGEVGWNDFVFLMSPLKLVELFTRFADAARVFKDISKTYKFSVAGMITVVAALFSVLYPSSESESPATVNLTSWTRTRTLSQAEKYPSLPIVLAQGEKQLGNYDFGARMDVQVQDCSSDIRWKKTFPDLDYSLLGYDIIYGNPLANGRDAGLRHQIFSADFSKPTQSSDCRYVIPAGLFAVSSESCDVSFESKLVRNKQEMKNHLGAQAKVEGGGWGFEFSASASYQRDSSEMSKGEFLFVISHTECHNYYSTIDIMNPPPFHPGFLAWTKNFPIPTSVTRKSSSLLNILDLTSSPK
ncbi:PREDICTED: uncharacterized protein LOC107350219 [Acropora digitifera]|uniref:uncharacterized protein LOC107350219 n=1 Tax=Acropora digitifera TaxID=70779 RepID=UPI00077A5650|nr:PREDICTED: uncharacterized protein LOC107350219 [Acropora digitifera]